MNLIEEHQAAYLFRQELRRGDLRPEPDGQVSQPYPHACPVCGDVTGFRAVDPLYSRFICRECWHGWGSDAAPCQCSTCRIRREGR